MMTCRCGREIRNVLRHLEPWATWICRKCTIPPQGIVGVKQAVAAQTKSGMNPKHPKNKDDTAGMVLTGRDWAGYPLTVKETRED